MCFRQYLQNARASGMLFGIILAISLCMCNANIIMTWKRWPGQLVNKFHIPFDNSKLTDGLHSSTSISKSTSSKALPTKPDFCHDLDCPDFTVVNKTEDYEERAYVSTKWVSTTLVGVDFDAASTKMFFKLFDYIQGENAKKEKIAMTAPVLISVIPGPGPACDNNFTMSFFLSPKVADPPAPTDTTVYLSQLPRQMVYVSSFGGFASKDSWLKNAEKLAKALQKDSRPFNKDYFYTAGYDSPFKFIGRHNEIWFMAQN